MSRPTQAQLYAQVKSAERYCPREKAITIVAMRYQGVSIQDVREAATYGTADASNENVARMGRRKTYPA